MGWGANKLSLPLKLFAFLSPAVLAIPFLQSLAPAILALELLSPFTLNNFCVCCDVAELPASFDFELVQCSAVYSGS